jgi:hypothetical protein
MNMETGDYPFSTHDEHATMRVCKPENTPTPQNTPTYRPTATIESTAVMTDTDLCGVEPFHTVCESWGFFEYVRESFSRPLPGVTQQYSITIDNGDNEENSEFLQSQSSQYQDNTTKFSYALCVTETETFNNFKINWGAFNPGSDTIDLSQGTTEAFCKFLDKTSTIRWYTQLASIALMLLWLIRYARGKLAAFSGTQEYLPSDEEDD